MNKNQLIKKTENFVKRCLSKEGTGHDWWHVVRVRNNAKLINHIEKADDFIIDLSVLLHDVGDRKILKKEADDYSIAENFLISNMVSKDILDQVMFIIKNMSFSKTLNKKSENVSKEFMVVQDADRLDAIGAIGIARAFAYGGNKERLLYDPTKKARNIKNKKQYHKFEASTYHHFEEKLLLLKDLMNTKTAQKIAKNRDLYMQKFLKQFVDEWNGIK